jgi:hypothetical protein
MIHLLRERATAQQIKEMLEEYPSPPGKSKYYDPKSGITRRSRVDHA